jgi:hypothetical protein
MSYEQYIHVYGKNYFSLMEYARRQGVYESNLAVIDRLNAEAGGARFGVNKVARTVCVSTTAGVAYTVADV